MLPNGGTWAYWIQSRNESALDARPVKAPPGATPATVAALAVAGETMSEKDSVVGYVVVTPRLGEVYHFTFSCGLHTFTVCDVI